MSQLGYIAIYTLCFIYAINCETMSCTTPNNIPGHCIDIRDCRPLWNIMKKKPVSALNRRFVKKAKETCGPHYGGYPIVCCALDLDLSDIPIPFDEKKLKLLPMDQARCGSQVTRLADRSDTGGKDLHLDEHPWIVLIKYRHKQTNDEQFLCGGALINNRYVLTAAHCLTGNIRKNFQPLNVRFGEHDLMQGVDCVENTEYKYSTCNEAPRDVGIEKEIIHALYNPRDINHVNDIALIRLNKTLMYSQFIQPLCLPLTDFDMQLEFVGLNLTAIAWGKTENQTNSNVKLKLELSGFSQDSCRKAYSYTNRISDRQICAGAKNTCSGVNGGPLMAYLITCDCWMSVGVASYGPTACPQPDKPGVFTKTAAYAHWIVDQLEPW